MRASVRVRAYVCVCEMRAWKRKKRVLSVQVFVRVQEMKILFIEGEPYPTKIHYM